VPEEWPDPNDPENGCDSLWWGRADRAAAEFAIADMQSTLYGFLWTFGEPEDEIWLTEIGCLNPSTTACGDDTFMFEYVSTVMGWLNGNGRWIDRYAWFSDWDPGTVDCEDPLDPEFDGGKWSWQMLYDLTATPLPPYNPCITPTPTSTPSVPFHTPTPTPIPGMQYSALGVYYSEVIPAPPALKPWPTHFLYLPSIFNE
jgi:hypothetical protein